jgi:C-terminal processing protease CtpA/Prc
MVAAFAAENGLATIVGTETGGRLIPGSGMKVGEGYMLIMPRAQYITWAGRRFEGKGVEPQIECIGDRLGGDGEPAISAALLNLE